MEIPIGGDYSGLETALAGVVDAIDRMGARIEASLNKSAAATERAASSMGRMASQAHAAATGANAAGAASATTAQRMMSWISTAGELGHSLSGVASGIGVVRNAAKAMKAADLVTRFTGWVRSAGGVRGALTSIGTRLSTLVKSPAFKKIAIGAAAATVAIGGTVLAVKGVRAGLNLVRGVADRVFGGITSRAKQAASAVKGVTSSVASVATGGGGGGGLLGPLSGLAGMIGAGGLLFVAVSQFKSAWSDAADFEQMQTNIEQFTGSAQKSAAILADMSAFGVKTPFELPDLGGGVSKLLSAGLGDRSTQLIKDLGAVSKNGETLGELADALAKGFTKGKFQTEELNKFLERGINLKPQLVEVTGLSGKMFDRAIEAGLGFDQVAESIGRMSQKGQMFYGMLDRQSATAIGRISNLSDAWGALRRNFMMPILQAVKPIIMDLTAGLESMADAAKSVGEKLGRGIAGAYVLIKDGKAIELLVKGFNYAVQSATDLLTRGLRGAVAFLAVALPAVFDAATKKFTDPDFWWGVEKLFTGLGESIGAEIREAVPFGDKSDLGLRRAGAKNDMRQGMNLITDAGGGNMSAAIIKAMADGGEAAAKAMGGPDIDDLTKARKDWQRMFEGVNAKIGAHFERGAVPPPPQVADPAASASLGMENNPGVRQATMVSTSLAKVGGGGFGMLVSESMVNQQQRTNQLLSKGNSIMKTIAEKVSIKQRGAYA